MDSSSQKRAYQDTANRKKAYRTRDQQIDNDATIDFIKQVLCASRPLAGPSKDANFDSVESKPLNELLPSLTSSNDVDLQLYAIIAAVLRQFVQSWYNAITPDQDFTSGVVHIIAHCTRALEQRFRRLDLELLVLDEIPALLLTHVDAARNLSPLAKSTDSIRLIYHSIQAHKALSPLPSDGSEREEQYENEHTWSQLLVSRILPMLLPPEDLQNPCLRVLVAEVLSDTIVHRAILGKVSEPWMIWGGIAGIVRVLRPSVVLQRPNEVKTASISRLEKFGLMSPPGLSDPKVQRATGGKLDATARAFWSFLQLGWIVWSVVQSLTTAYVYDSSTQEAPKIGEKAESPSESLIPMDVSEAVRTQHIEPRVEASQRPVISMRLWSCISRLTEINHRMPWLIGLLSLLQWLLLYGPGELCRAGGALDSFLSSQISQRVLRPALVPQILLSARNTLFPNNALAPARPIPTAAEAQQIKRECATTIVDAIPETARNVYFATKDRDLMREDVEATLDLFCDPYINKHLIVSIVELLVVRLFPETAEDAVDAY